MASKTWFCLHAMYLGMELEYPTPARNWRPIFMIRSGCAYGNGCSRTVSTTVKIAVLAPVPSASAVTAIAVKLGFLRIIRKA
jgi:hypothetical protein